MTNQIRDIEVYATSNADAREAAQAYARDDMGVVVTEFLGEEVKRDPSGNPFTYRGRQIFIVTVRVAILHGDASDPEPADPQRPTNAGSLSAATDAAIAAENRRLLSDPAAISHAREAGDAYAARLAADPDDSYDESTNPSNGWRAPAGAYEPEPTSRSTIEEVVGWLEQQPGGEEFLSWINNGTPAAEALAAFKFERRSSQREYRVLVVVQSRTTPSGQFAASAWEQMISSADRDNPFSAYITGSEQAALEAAGAAGQAIEEYRIEQPTGATR
jgi:hypothetical protein